MTKVTNHLLDYLATYPDATMRFYASDMILNIHSDASYLSVKNSQSRAEISPGATSKDPPCPHFLRPDRYDHVRHKAYMWS